jgi:hypothetical protein
MKMGGRLQGTGTAICIFFIRKFEKFNHDCMEPLLIRITGNSFLSA